MHVVQWLLGKGAASTTETGIGGDSALLVASRAGELPVVQWLLTEGGATITETYNAGSYNAGSSSLLKASYSGQSPVVQWLLTEGGASITETNNPGASVWDCLLQDPRPEASDSALRSLLRFMLLEREPPPAFRRFLASELRLELLDSEGVVLRATVPGYLVWLRALLLVAHTPLPPPGLVDIVVGYAVLSVEDLLNSERVAVTGHTRPREDDGEGGARPSLRQKVA